MAFKTDTIKLKEDYTSNPSGTEGELAVVGTVGNRVLKLYDNSAWKDLSASTGASQLSELSDVPSAPVTQYHVGKINANAQMEFGFLTLSNISTGAIDTAGNFNDDDTHIMTSAAVDDRINGKFSNVVKHNAWTSAVEIASGAGVLNSIFYNTTDQGSTYALAIPPVSSYSSNARVEVINGSDENMNVTRKDSSDASFNWQAGGGTVTQVDITSGQRALFLSTGSIWEVIVLSL